MEDFFRRLILGNSWRKDSDGSVNVEIADTLGYVAILNAEPVADIFAYFVKGFIFPPLVPMMMSEVLIIGIVGVSLGVYILLRIHRLEHKAEIRRLELINLLPEKNELKQVIDAFDSIEIPELPNLDSLRDTIIETVEDVMGSIQMPTGADHLMGAVSMFIQQKIMTQMPEGVQGLVQGMVNEDEPPSE